MTVPLFAAIRAADKKQILYSVAFRAAKKRHFRILTSFLDFSTEYVIKQHILFVDRTRFLIACLFEMTTQKAPCVSSLERMAPLWLLIRVHTIKHLCLSQIAHSGYLLLHLFVVSIFGTLLFRVCVPLFNAVAFLSGHVRTVDTKEQSAGNLQNSVRTDCASHAEKRKVLLNAKRPEKNCALRSLRVASE